MIVLQQRLWKYGAINKLNIKLGMEVHYPYSFSGKHLNCLIYLKTICRCKTTEWIHIKNLPVFYVPANVVGNLWEQLTECLYMHTNTHHTAFQMHPPFTRREAFFFFFLK